MAESSSTDGEAVQGTTSNVLQAGLKGGAYSFVISTCSAVVVKDICGAAVGVTKELGGAAVGVTKELGGANANAVEITKVVCGTTVTLALIYTGYNLLKPVIDAAVKKGFGGERDDQEVLEIRPGSLHVLLRCFTNERFLEVLTDYESGQITERLQEEFSQINGIEVEGLKVDIENMEEVEKTKAAINKRESKPITERTQFQKERLAIEKSVLERCWPGQVTWIDPAGESKVEVSLITNNGNRYFLRLYLEPDFPYSAPDMVVRSSPNPMPSWGVDGDKHTLGNRDGFLKICHCRPSSWTSSSTLYDVVMKGRLWLEAYEGYLMTGNDLSTFLVVMKLRE